MKNFEVENKQRAGSNRRHEDLSSFLTAPAEGAEEVQEESIGLGYPGCASGELSCEDIGNQRDEVKLKSDDRSSATVCNPSDKLTGVNSLNEHSHGFDDADGSQLSELKQTVGHDPVGVNMMYQSKIEDPSRQLTYDYDKHFSKFEIDSPVRKTRTNEHHFDIIERAQMKDNGAIPKIPNVKNYSKSLDPMGHINLRDIGAVDADRFSDLSNNPPKSSVNAVTKFETYCQEVAEKEDKTYLANSTCEKTSGPSSVQGKFVVNEKLAMQLNGGDKAVGHRSEGVMVEDFNRQFRCDYDALFSQSKNDFPVSKMHTYEHSIDMKVKMKAQGAIPKIPAMKNYSKPLDPMDEINSLSHRKCYLGDIGAIDTDRPSNCSENAVTKLEATARKDATVSAEKEDGTNLASSSDEKAGDLLNVQDKFMVENKLAMEPLITNGEKSSENNSNATVQYNTPPRGIPHNRDDNLMTGAPAGLILPNCVGRSITAGTTEITDLLTTAQLQIENLQISSQKSELSLGRRDMGQERRRGPENSSKDRTTERHQSAQANRKRPRSAQRSKISHGEGRRSAQRSKISHGEGRRSGMGRSGFW